MQKNIIDKIIDNKDLSIEKKLDYIFIVFTLFDKDEDFINALVEIINEVAGYEEKDIMLKDFIEGLQYLKEENIDEIIDNIKFLIISKMLIDNELEGLENEEN